MADSTERTINKHIRVLPEQWLAPLNSKIYTGSKVCTGYARS